MDIFQSYETGISFLDYELLTSVLGFFTNSWAISVYSVDQELFGWKK